MKSNINESPLKSYNSIPRYWESRPKTQLYNTLPESELILDGWRDIIIPERNSETQKLGELIAVNDTVTHVVIDIPESELRQNLINQIESAREQVIQKEIKEKAIKEIQLKDGSEALKYKYAYPLWESGILCKLNHKYSFIEADKTISLYKCLIEHLVDGTRIPSSSATYFTKVTESIIPWTGGINAIKDRLYSFGGKNYRCLENHLTIAGQDPTKAKAYWLEEKV